ncbi:MAG: hypothetical protein Q4G18_00955 [Myroides sp.]|nr:hypothetical protein [Myroides sp.]
MKRFLSLICLCIYVVTYSQTYTTNFNVDTSNSEIEKISSLWHTYLKTPSKKFWKTEEVASLNNFNIQNMPSILNPPLLDWKLNNRILSISNLSDTKYLLKSAFFNNDLEIFALTNVVVEKIENEYKISNYIYHHTDEWKTYKQSNIKYIYTPSFKLPQHEVKKAERLYNKLCEVFKVTPEPITYFIAEDCDAIYTLLGYDFFISKGMGKECGYFESDNNFVFATKKGGANHYHELTHFINKFYPNANSLLLTGLSAYISKDKAHFGKPLSYHIKRVNEYLQSNPHIDLSDPFEFYYMDEKTNPQYVIGALLCDLIIEKEGKDGLLKAFQNYGSNEELLDYLNKNILDNKSLNKVLKDKIHILSKEKKFENKLGI